MREEFERRVDDLARRAGLSGIPSSVVIAGMLVVAVALAWAAWHWWPSPERSTTGSLEQSAGALTPAASLNSSAATSAAARPAGSQATSASTVWVDVVGAVRHPGLYGLDGEARVNDAIDAAGGLLGNAAKDAVNLARKASDGEQIRVPTQSEAKSGGAASAGPVGEQGSPAGTGASQAAVDLNSASAAQLDTLPGVGPATALRILADRQANGPFKSVEDLGRVSGIGPKKLDQLKSLVVVH